MPIERVLDLSTAHMPGPEPDFGSFRVLEHGDTRPRSLQLTMHHDDAWRWYPEAADAWVGTIHDTGGDEVWQAGDAVSAFGYAAARRMAEAAVLVPFGYVVFIGGLADKVSEWAAAVEGWCTDSQGPLPVHPIEAEPEWLRPILYEACLNGCAFIVFDCDGCEHDGLPIHDWDI